jgi:hypothetical protein
MQAIARANRVYPGKDCGVIVDYNGMLKSLREALAQYASGRRRREQRRSRYPIEELVRHSSRPSKQPRPPARFGLRAGPADYVPPASRKIAALRAAVNALYTSDEAKRRFEIMAREVFVPVQGAAHGAVASAPTTCATTTSRPSTRSSRSASTPRTCPRSSRNCTRSSTMPSGAGTGRRPPRD